MQGGNEGWRECSFVIKKERLESSLVNRRRERLPQVVALCTNRTEMAQTVTVQAGEQSVEIFAAKLLQYTGERFLQPLLQTPDGHGCATISLQESSVPALVTAFQILDHEAIPDRVSVPEYLQLMLTLSSCNAWSTLEALTSSLVPEKHNSFRGSYQPPFQKTEVICVQALRISLKIMKLFLPGLTTSQGDSLFTEDVLAELYG